VKTLFAHIKNFLEKFFGSTQWERVAMNTLNVVAPLIETVLALTAGEPIAAEVGVIVGKVQAGLKAATDLVTSAQSGTAKDVTGEMKTVLTGIQSNLTELLAAAQIKNPDTLSKVTAVVNVISQEVTAVLEAMPSTPAPAAPPA